MRTHLKLALAAAVALAPTAAFADPNKVSNGSFEDPKIHDPCCNTVPPDALDSWKVTGGDVNVVNGTYNGTAGGGSNLAYAGNQYLDLVGQSGTGSITQALNLVIGQTYQLTFAYSNNIFGGAPTASGTYSIGGLTGTVVHNTATASNLDWTVFSGTFVATKALNDLVFTSGESSQNGSLFLDGVSVAAVPEAATWLMMILGFGLAGGTLRQRRRKLALA